MTTTKRLALTCVAAVLALTMAACGGSTSEPSGSAPTAGVSTGSSSATGSTESSADASAGTKVSANTASEEEISAALTSAGVSNPERWTEEVIEYRPYPAEDPNFTTLRDELVKYNPGQETIDAIVSALTP
jgi:hypothetical protein